ARVPGHRVRRRRVFRAQGRAVELELDTGHARVVARARGDGDAARDRRSGRGGGDAHRRRRGVAGRDGGRGGHAGVARGVARDGPQAVEAGGRGGGVPRGRIRRRRVLRPQVGAVELELHADDAHVVRSIGSDGDGPGDGRSAGRGSDGDGGRSLVV